MRQAFFLPALTLLLAACANSGSQKDASTTVDIAGGAYRVTQLTAGTFTVTTVSGKESINGNTPGRQALRSAVEKTSGCKVTDSDYSQQGLQFDAQVDCGSRLKN
ncbi:MAG: hypothetical protein V4614_02705 [Pseudomonadota bacterium]